ncbi:MAG: hypothetical protein ABJA50_12480 [Chloroflexota bacterium]
MTQTESVHALALIGPIPNAPARSRPGAPRGLNSRPAGLLALLVGLGAVLYAWYEQYAVDAETTLLPWLIRRGWVLYTDLVDQHPPLLPWLLVPFDGDPGMPLRVFIVALRAVTLVLTYVVARRLCGAWGALVTLTGAALWAIGANASHLWYDGALAPIYLVVLLLLVAPDQSPRGTRDRVSATAEVPRALALGVLLAAALLLKQHALVAVPGVILALAWDRHGRGRRVAAFALGLLVPLTLAGVYFILHGASQAAAYWVIAYSIARNYVSAAGMAPAGDTWWPIIAVAPALALGVAGIARGVRHVYGKYFRLWVAGPGLLLAATLPIWPRYGRFHLQAAIPLLAVAAAASAVLLRDTLRQRRWQTRFLSVLAGLLLAVYFITGASEASTSFRIQTQLPPVAAPYAGTVPPLVNWVGAHTLPDAPIVLYGVDALLYRVLEHPPPRPWVPQLAWILAAGDTEARWWLAMAWERPSIALVAASWWDSGASASDDPGPGWLRANYHADVRFALSVYPGAPSVSVVGLVLNSSGP